MKNTFIKQKKRETQNLKDPAYLCIKAKPKVINLKIFIIHFDCWVYFLKLSLHNNKVMFIVYLELPVYD